MVENRSDAQGCVFHHLRDGDRHVRQLEPQPVDGFSFSRLGFLYQRQRLDLEYSPEVIRRNGLHDPKIGPKLS